MAGREGALFLGLIKIYKVLLVVLVMVKKSKKNQSDGLSRPYKPPKEKSEWWQWHGNTDNLAGSETTDKVKLPPIEYPPQQTHSSLGVRHVKETEEDSVNRTFRLYGTVIKKAFGELRKENPNFGRYETSPGHYAEAKVGDGEVTGISFKDTKALEGKVREITGDSKAKLMRNVHEYHRLLKRGYGVATIIAVLGGIFFLSSNITGNAIADLTTKTTSFLSAGLLIVGLVVGFFWLRRNR